VALWCVPLGVLAVLGEAYFRSNLGDSDTPEQCSCSATAKLLESHHVRTLETEGIVIIPNALGRPTLQTTRQDLQSFLHSNNNDNPAEEQVANHTANDADVRQDLVAWVSAKGNDKAAGGEADDKSDHKHVNLQHCIDLVRGVTHALQEHEYSSPIISNEKQQQHSNTTSTHTFTQATYRIPRDCQLAWYPGDGSASYKRHLDKCQKTIWDLGILEWLRLSDYRERSVTVILYLNKADRPESDGGALRCWVAKEPSSDSSTETTGSNEDNFNNHNKDCQSSFDPPFDVQPKGGTLVIFQSDKVEHMVLPSIADRYALTSWIARIPAGTQ
jgi:hypothetical protein